MDGEKDGRDGDTEESAVCCCRNQERKLLARGGKQVGKLTMTLRENESPMDHRDSSKRRSIDNPRAQARGSSQSQFLLRMNDLKTVQQHLS
jgi:hypothetical protein